MRKFTLLLTAFLTLGASLALANVKGTVVSGEGDEPVIGASIMVKGTTNGTITDIDGTFELSTSDGDILVVSYIGMKTQEVAAKNGMTIHLEEDAQMIDEVITVAYGTSTKKSFTGSATVVSSEKIEKKNATEVSKALAGEVAGVRVVNSSGQPGTSATIVVRGMGSVNASSTPLYVVDGVPFDGDISGIDPSDIASTTVLKDATATSLYGSRGANGVILITTKTGTAGSEAKIDVDVKYGGNMRLLPMYDVISTPEEYLTMSWQSLYNNYRYAKNMTQENAVRMANNNLFSDKGIPTAYNIWNMSGNLLVNPYAADGSISPSLADGISRKAGYENMESWKDNIFRVGQKAEATVKISGGSDKTTYYTSFGYLKDEGYYIGSDFNRFSVRSNISHQAKKWLKGNLNMNYSYSELNDPGQSGDGTMNNGFYYVNCIPAIYPVFERNADGTIKKDSKTGLNAYDYGMNEGEGRLFGSGINPAGALQLDKQKTITHQLQTTGMLEVQFYKDLKLTANVGLTYVGQNASELTNPYYGDAAGVGRLAKQQVNYLGLTANQLLEYNKQINDHSIRVLAGHETQFVRQSIMYGSKNYLALPDNLEWSNAIQMSSMSGYTTETSMESYLATANYNYAERYFINGSYRADGSSRFAKGHRWGHFGSVGAAWVITNEEFMSDSRDWLRNLKLRASWGMLGNQEIGSFLYTDQYSVENVDDQVAYIWSYKGNPDLTWERTSTVDVGLEFEITKYLTGEVDYYYKKTSNLLFPRYVAPSLGYSYYYVNDGKLSNQGVEFQLTAHAVDTRNVKLDIRLNGSHNTNRMEEMPIDYYDESGKAVRMVMNGSMAKGHDLYDWYMVEYVGVDRETGEAQYRAYYDADKGTFGTSSADQIESGNNYIASVFDYKHDHPDANIRDTITTDYNVAGSNYVGKTSSPILDGGIAFDLDVYGVSLSATFLYRIGGYGYDNTYASLMNNDRVGSVNWHTDMRNAWTENNRDTDIPRLSNYADTYTNAASTRFLTSNSFFSLSNVQLGYTFPKKWTEKIKMNVLKIWVSADNLFVASARRGYNPMASYTGTTDSWQYTPLSTIMGGIKIQF